MSAECLHAWNLAVDPFESASRPLAPPADLTNYFDFYVWLDKSRLSSLADDGRIKIGDLSTGRRMMTLLLSGAQGCGRTSLKNLLRYELTQRSPAPSLVVEFVVTPVINRGQVALSLTRALARVAKVRDPTAETDMTATIDGW